MKFRLKLNPIYKKEMKQSVRSIKLPLFLVLFNSILAIISLIAFYVTNEQVRLSGNIDYRSNIYLYIFMISMEFALLVFIIPAMSSGLISGERERQTLDILLTSALRPGQIIFGKLFSVIGSITLILFSGLPVIALAFVYGGVNAADMALAAVYLIFSAAFLGSIGIFCSAAVKKTTFATVLTYGIEVALFFAPLIIVVLARYIRFAQTAQQDGTIGAIALVLLISPGVTFLDIMFNQVGAINFIDNQFIKLGLNSFVADHFTAISLIVQLLMVAAFISLSVFYVRHHGENSHKRRHHN